MTPSQSGAKLGRRVLFGLCLACARLGAIPNSTEMQMEWGGGRAGGSTRQKRHGLGHGSCHRTAAVPILRPFCLRYETLLRCAYQALARFYPLAVGLSLAGHAAPARSTSKNMSKVRNATTSPSQPSRSTRHVVGGWRRRCGAGGQGIAVAARPPRVPAGLHCRRGEAGQGRLRWALEY